MSETQQFREDLDRVLASLWRPLAGARVTAAVSTAGGEIVACRWQFLDAGENSEVRPTIDYGSFTLREEWIEGQTNAADLLVEISAGLKGFFGGAPLTQYPYSKGTLQRKVSPWQGFSGHSEWVLTAASLGNMSNDWLYVPAVRVGLAPYESGAAAVNDWIWKKRDPNGNAVEHSRQIVVVIPDTRARFVETTWSPERLDIKIECRSSNSEIEAQCIITTTSGVRQLPNQNLNAEGKIGWDVPPNTLSAETFLVHTSGDLLAKGGFTNTGHTAKVRNGPPTIDERAQSDLTIGERETVEYKPFIEKGNDKWQQVAKTVVAFANTQGGCIYLGVTDDAQTMGRIALERVCKNAAHVAHTHFRNVIDKCVRDCVKPIPDFVIHQITVSNDPVFVVEVKKDNKGPYSTHENDVYI